MNIDQKSGIVLDVDIANAQVGPWLADIAHQRIHGTTGEKPQTLLDKEQPNLMPLPYLHESVNQTKLRSHRQALPIESIQHPLSIYDQLLESAL